MTNLPEETENNDKNESPPRHTNDTAAAAKPADVVVEVDAETGDAVTPDDSEPSDNDDTKTKKRKHMTVAADAPWKDRMWEGPYVQ